MGLYLSKSEEGLVSDLLKVSSDTVNAVVSHFQSKPDVDPFTKSLQVELETIDRVGEDDAASILTHVYWIGSLSERNDKNSNKLVNEIAAELSEFERDDLSAKEWESRALLLNVLVDNSAFRAARKAIELSYDFPDVFRRAQIYTDIRPVFDLGVENITSAVISHCLRLSYTTGERVEDLALVMENREIIQLKEQCERAIKKGNVAEQLLNSVELPARVSGKDENLDKD